MKPYHVQATIIYASNLNDKYKTMNETIIYKTKEYDMFHAINGNRVLNKAKVDKIASDINGGFNMLPYVPIMVSEKQEKLFIIDGQHRLGAAKKLNTYIYYVICKEITLKQIAMLNSRSDKWKAGDFLNCYINLGIDDYHDIDSIMKTYKINIKVATDLLMFYNVRGNSTDAFRSGEFKSNYMTETMELLELVEKLFGMYTFSKDRYLIGAVQAIDNKGVIDWERLKSKIKTKPMIMDRQPDVKQYILNIERLYNDGLQNRVLLT